MKIIKTKDYTDLTNKTITLFLESIEQLKHQARINIAITGGNSPKLFYTLIADAINHLSYLSKLHFYNFDEIPFKDDLKTGITIQELNKLFFNHVNVASTHIHKLTVLNYKEHMRQIQRDGGLDLVLLGIGTDGHFCGNMSGVTKFGDSTRLITHEAFKQVAKVDTSQMDFSCLADHFVTMGPRDIMQVRQIIMIANGAAKADVINQIVHGPVDEAVPASILTLHPFFTLIIDTDANAIAKV